MSIVPEDFCDKHVCVFGLGYVGLTLSAVMADIGFHVVGAEVRDDVRRLIRAGESPFHEPGLDQKLKKIIKAGRFQCVDNLTDEHSQTVYIITVGTPLGPGGEVNLASIRSVANEIAARLKAGDLVIMRSTVKLGTTRQVVASILDSAGIPYELAFCPERTLEGNALAELRVLPQIVGSGSPATRLRAAQIFSFLTPTVVQVSSVETAELIKLVDNTQRDVSFGFANEVARICDATGINAKEVILSGKLAYPRTNLPMPGPVGGPCLEKDPHILTESLRDFRITPTITVAARTLNENQPGETVDRMISWLKQYDVGTRPIKVTLAGLAFKGAPITDDLRGTMAKPILSSLQQALPNATFCGYDPIVRAETIREFFNIEPVDSLESSFEGASLVVIANNHPSFAAMNLEILAQLMSTPGLIYDYWNKFEGTELSLPDGIGYTGLGTPLPLL